MLTQRWEGEGLGEQRRGGRGEPDGILMANEADFCVHLLYIRSKYISKEKNIPNLKTESRKMNRKLWFHDVFFFHNKSNICKF